MSKLTRQIQKIFAGASANNQKAVFGSMKTGNPVYFTNVEALQSADYEQGWQNALMQGKAPFLEEMNGVQYVLSRQLAYLFQSGIPEWLATDTYYENSFCRVGNSIYYSLIDDNTGNNPSTTTGFWQETGNYDTATSLVSGLTKLYSTSGSNTDGTITQAGITNLLPTLATSTDAGIVKLYSEAGNNTDGTITQAVITSLFNNIRPDATLSQKQTTITGGSVVLDNSIVLYNSVPSGATTFTFDASNVDTANVITFELSVDLSTSYSLTFPNNVVWQNGEAPDLSVIGIYYFVFRTVNGGATWLGNLQGRF